MSRFARNAYLSYWKEECHQQQEIKKAEVQRNVATTIHPKLSTLLKSIANPIIFGGKDRYQISRRIRARGYKEII